VNNCCLTPSNNLLSPISWREQVIFHEMTMTMIWSWRCPHCTRWKNETPKICLYIFL